MTMLIALRKRHPALRRHSFFRGRGPLGDLRPDVIWHGVEENRPDFSPGSRTLAFALDGSQTGREPDRDFYIVCNAWIDTVEFHVPASPSDRAWRRVIDTALASPLDIVQIDKGPLVPHGSVYPVTGHSLLVLVTEAGPARQDDKVTISDCGKTTS